MPSSHDIHYDLVKDIPTSEPEVSRISHKLSASEMRHLWAITAIAIYNSNDLRPEIRKIETTVLQMEVQQ